MKTTTADGFWLRPFLLPAWLYPEGSLARLNADAVNEEILYGFGIDAAAFGAVDTEATP